MRLGEKAQFSVGYEYHYGIHCFCRFRVSLALWPTGELGCPPLIPPATTLYFIISLVKVEPPFERPDAQMPIAYQFSLAEKQKEEGNRQFGRKAWRQAITAYNRVCFCCPVPLWFCDRSDRVWIT